MASTRAYNQENSSLLFYQSLYHASLKIMHVQISKSSEKCISAEAPDYDGTIKCSLLVILYVIHHNYYSQSTLLFQHLHHIDSSSFITLLHLILSCSQTIFTPLSGLSITLKCLYAGCCCFLSCWSTARSADSWLLGSGMEGCEQRPMSPFLHGNTGGFRWLHLRSF